MATPLGPAITSALKMAQPPSTPAVNLDTPSTASVKSDTTKEVTAPNPVSRSPDISSPSKTSYTITIPSFSGWFSYDKIHETERRLLPEFFDGKSASRNPKVYKYIRDTIIKRFRANPSKKITFSKVRRSLVCDVGSIRRVFEFLEIWGLINYTPSKSSAKEKKEAVENVEKKESPKKLCSSCKTVCSLVCFGTDKSDIILCARCFVRGNYRPGLNSTDFKRVDIGEEKKSDWTEKDTLHLLEAINHYNDDWKKVAEHVGGRTVKECVAKFISLPFGEQYIGSTNENGDSMGAEYGQESEMESLDAKRKHLTPLADSSNPIMAQVAFLSALVGSDAAEAAAQSAVSALHEEKHYSDDCATNGQSTIKEAKTQLMKEQLELEQSITNIVEVEMKEIQEKIMEFENLELQMEKERQQLRYMKDLFFADQLGFMQHKLRGETVKKVKTSEAS